MKKDKKEVVEETPIEEVVEEAPKKAGKSVKVFSSTGAFVREYTEEQSEKGFDYKQKAESYAKKIGGTVK